MSENRAGRLWIDATLDEVRGRLTQRLATLADLKLTPPDSRVSGKLLRPRLLLTLAATAAEPVPSVDRVASLATAVEMIHLATLYHDDVLDDSPHRRRAASVREVFGNKMSILFGDALVAGAFDIILRCASRRMQAAVIRAVTVTLRGEVEQHLGHRALDLSEAECVKVARLKTGSLFGLAARLGALVGGADPGGAAAADRLGRRLGTAFQLIDDALDYAGDAELLGKEPGADYRQGIATLPLVGAWRASSGGDRRVVQAGFGQDEGSDFSVIREIVLRPHHFVPCLETARRQLSRALADLPLIAPGPRGALLTEYVGDIERRIPDVRRAGQLSKPVG